MWRDIQLDIDIKKKKHLNIEANQADDLLLTIYLYNNGVPLNLVSGEDTVIVNYVNANNTITADSNIGKNFDENLLKIYLNKNCTNSYGVAKMQVTINTTKKDVTNRQVTTFPIEIKVNKSIMDGQEVSKNVNSMINDLNTCIINAKEIIKNIEETEKLYPSTSGLYTDVQSLNTRKMGSINLLRDAGFISKNIGDGFDWKLYNPNGDASVTIEDSTTSLSRLCAKITVGTNIQRGIYQQVYSYDKGTDYTITCKVKGTAGYVIRFKLSGSVEREYTIQNDDTWESVVIKFSNKNIPTTWDTAFCIYGMKTGTFYVENVLLCEGGNPITFAYNPVDLVGKRLKISGQDVLDIEQEGLYCGANCINAPENNCWFYYDIKIHSTTYKSITAFSYNFNKVYIKTSENGIWRDWEQITTQTLAKNPANITQDSTHRFVTDAEKNKWNMVTGSGALQQNSYCKLPNGLIIQWGVTSLSIESGKSASNTAVFPIEFPNRLLNVQANINRNITTKDKTGCENILVNVIMASGISTDKKQVTIFGRDCIGSGENWSFEVGWFAIGY